LPEILDSYCLHLIRCSAVDVMETLSVSDRPRPKPAGITDRGPGDWESWLAWLLRLSILGTAIVHVLEGAVLYALLCALVIVALMAPPLLAGTRRANFPIEIELAALWGAMSDMTLGRLAGLYEGTIWFDKALHFGNSFLIGILAFLIICALHCSGRLRTSYPTNVLIIALLALGIGALWEIAEYAADLYFSRGAQGSPVMTALDDTMWDLILDGAGGTIGGIVGSAYLRFSRRTRRQMEAFARIVPEEQDSIRCVEQD